MEPMPVPPLNDRPSFNERPPYGPPPKKKKKTAGKIILALLLLGAGYGLYSLGAFYLTPDRKIQQIYLIPKDAAIIIESSEPVADWNRFSRSAPWQTLKEARSFAQIAAQVGTLDSTIRANKTLLGMVGKRDLLISLHKTRSGVWDFLTVVDLQKVSKMEPLKEQIEQILGMTGATVTNRRYNGINILEMRDPDTREILYMAFVDNHLVASYNTRLVEASIDERDDPQIGLDPAFIDVEKLVAGKGLCRLYIHYAYLPQFLGIYLGTPNEYLEQFSRSMDFAGLSLQVDDRTMQVSGYTLLKEEADPYLGAFFRSGSRKMAAQEILSARTAFYTNIGFDDPATFVRELESALQGSDPAGYKSYRETREKLEKYFGISFEKNFLSWMAGEFALTQSEPGLLGREPELILAIRARNIHEARESMALLEKRIKLRSPVKVETVHYKEYEINYMEMKGFFRLFFGKLLDRFEKPYYTYVGDYVVFSNRSASLLSFIEDYEQGNLLREDPAFREALARSEHTSTWFNYVDIPKFFPQLQPLLSGAAWGDLQRNREVLYAFPHWSFQIVAGPRQTAMQWAMDYRPLETGAQAEVQALASGEVDPETLEDPLPEEQVDVLSQGELMNELQRFYVEKFQGNVLREFYPGGALMSESETRNGQRNGRYREYYESGKLKARGRYVNNQPKGTWKYYTEEGAFDRREKH